MNHIDENRVFVGNFLTFAELLFLKISITYTFALRFINN